MSGRSIIVALCVAIALSMVAVPAMAGEESGTETIFGMDPFFIEFENTGSEEMKVSWDIKVTSGAPINVVLLDEENRDKFPGLAYEAYKDHEYSYVNSSKKSERVDEGKYFLAIEGAHSSEDTSVVEYEVVWSTDDGSWWEDWCCPASIVVGGVAGVAGVMWWRRRESMKDEPPPDGSTLTETAPPPGTG